MVLKTEQTKVRIAYNLDSQTFGFPTFAVVESLSIFTTLGKFKLDNENLLENVIEPICSGYVPF